MRKLLLLFIALLTGVSGAWAQRAVTAGSQVTSESNLVSGKAYLLQHQGNGTNTPWIEDAGANYNCPNSAGNCNTAAIWYLYNNGDGTWKIKNYHTGMYWPKPTENANLVGTTEENAGSWTLNFSDGVTAPTCNGYRLNRNTPYLVGWDSGSGSVTKVKIYEVSETFNTLIDDLKGKKITVGDAVSSFTTNKWYVIRCNTPEDGGYYRGTIFETPGALYHNGNTTMSHDSKWLFRFEDAGETDKYYVETAYGNFFKDFTHNAQIGTCAPYRGKEKITVAKINSTDGHFYFKSETSGVIMDANGLASGVTSGNVVGWNTTVPSGTGGNNDWGIYEVEISDIVPTASEIYTINNLNTDRGPLIYAPWKSTKWVWISGKDDAAALDASNPNHQWIFYPTGTSGQYYLYNVGYQKFVIPVKGGTYSGYSWAFSSDAVAVSLVRQSNGTYKISTATGSVCMSVSKDYTGPIINYDDDGAEFTLTEVAEANSSITTQLNTALGKLIDSQTALTAKPSSNGWYAIKIQSSTNDASYANNYVYTLETEYNNSGTYYPLHHINPVKLRPAIDDALYYFYITQSGAYYMIQLPNGRRIRTNGTYFPLTSVEGSTVDIQYRDGGFFRFVASYKYADAYANFIGETGTADRTKYDIYPINLTTAGLTAWTVSIGSSTGNEKLVCSRSDASGLTSVYNNGYIFLPTGTTPTASDFSVTGGSYGYDYQITVNDGAKTITATPGHSFTLNKVGDQSWATLSLTYDATIPGIMNGGALVYTVSIVGERAKLEGEYTTSKATTLNEIPANVGVLVCANTFGETPAPTLFATKATTLSNPISNEGNALQPNDSEKTELAANEYVLGTSSGEIGFWKLGEGKKLAANKAYLTVPGGGSVKGYAIDFDFVNGINEISSSSSPIFEGSVYTLSGQRLSKPVKGINIINGKKLLVK